MSEEAPSLIGQAIGLTVAAAKQEQQGFRRQVLDLVLQRVQVDRIGHARITNNGVGAEDETARRCNEAAAPVSKTVTIERAALAQAGVVTYFFQGHFRRARPCSPGETNLSNDAGQVRHDPGQAGRWRSLPDQAQPQFGLIPAAQMTHNDVANTRYNNLDDDDCAA